MKLATKLVTKSIFSILLFTILTLSTLSLFAAAPVLRVQMYNGNRTSQINTIYPWFKLTNNGTEPIDLTKVKLRYFYTVDGDKPQNFWCDWSEIGANNITATFNKLTPAREDADCYLEIGFKTAAGTLKSGKSIQVQTRFAKQDWSNYNQLNDYSYNPIAATYVDWDRIQVITAGTKPTTTHDFKADDLWVNQPVTIRLTASSDSGQANTYYQLNQGTATAGNLIQLDTDGTYAINYWSENEQGDQETPKTINVKLDQTAPVISTKLNPTPNALGWNNSNLKIAFEALDLLSGVKDVTPVIDIATEGIDQTVTGTATDYAGNTSTKTVTLNVDKTLPLISIIQPADGTIVSDKKMEIVAELTDNLSGINPNSIQLTLDGKTINGTYNANTNRVTYTPATEYSAGSHTITVNVNDRAGNQALTTSSAFTVKGVETNLPPDPSTVAPKLDPTIVSDMRSATNFLYTGKNPIQTGIEPETIEPKRAAVIRGKVLDKNNQPLPGVKITILNHPEYGQTLSRVDGMFDLAVNGGGYLVVKYEKDGYLSIQRQVDVPWQDYALVNEVVLIPVDQVVTPIKLNATETQVARGSVITDKDGTRQATLIFPEGVKALGVNQDTINIRATEYTVGDNGPAAMPAELPAQIAYTYCVELAADGIETVEFNKPVHFYLENFLNFPVGSAVPVGYYDRAKGIWVPSDNGKIVKVLQITAGKAVLDTNGNGQAATTEELKKLSITNAELEKLATIYQPGQTLWRTPITHFTPFDCNWQYGPPIGAIIPALPKPKEGVNPDNNCPENNSIIQVQSQVLGEVIPIADTPFTLHYSSDRVSGNKSAKKLEIPLFEESIPSDVKRADLTVKVAGKEYKHSFAPQANTWTTFEWDGIDAYERKTRGYQKAEVTVSYIYDGVYYEPADFEKAFSLFSGAPLTNASRQEVALSQKWNTMIAGETIIPNAISGWGLDVHHQYDPKTEILYKGDGNRRSIKELPKVIQTIAGGGKNLLQVNPSNPAREINFTRIEGIASGPDGCIYLAVDNSIWKIDHNSMISRIVETSSSIGKISLITFGFDGLLYFYDTDNARVCRLNSDATINTIITGAVGLTQLAVGPDGSIYTLSGIGSDVLRYSTEGTCQIFARGYFIDYLQNEEYPQYFNENSFKDHSPTHQGKLLNEVKFPMVRAISIGHDGSVYLARECMIWKVTPSGIVHHFAGRGEPPVLTIHSPKNAGDGDLAIKADIECISAINAARDGNLYISTGGWRGWWGAFVTHDESFNYIRYVTSDGIIHGLSGKKNVAGYAGDNGPASQALINYPTNIITGTDNAIYFLDSERKLIRKISSPFPQYNNNDILIASEDSSQIYHFDPNGKHLQTLDALTKKPIYRFEYDELGNLNKITDINDKVTQITRAANGTPTGIIAPYGSESKLTVNNNGYLESVTNPAQEKFQMTYYQGGLLETFTDPKNGVTKFFYDDNGKLIKDEGQGGRVVQLKRTDINNGYTVTKTVSLTDQSEIVSTYQTEYLADGRTKWLVSGCCGGPIETIYGTDGTKTIKQPDGTVIVTQEGPDPRFGMQAPIIKSMTVTTPDGKKYVMTGERTVKLTDPNDLFSIETLTDTVTINGKTTTSIYDVETQTVTTTSPAGRKTVTTLDEFGRVTKAEVPGLAPAIIEYDTEGRLEKIISGTGLQARTSSIKYNAQGYVESTKDPLDRTTEFYYDAVGRVTRQVLPDKKEIVFDYDANGNVTKLTPPGKPEHSFGYTAVNLEETYTPPEVGVGENQTKYEYNLNKQPTLITRPDTQTIGFEYDTSGRLLDIILPNNESITYAYHQDNGNLVNIIAGSGTLTYDYDGSLLKKVTWAGLIKGSVEYEYNNDFNVTKVTVDDQDAVSYDYDDDGLLIEAGAVTLERNPENGMLTDIKIGSILEKLLYNQFGETDTYKATFNGSTIFETNYQTDKLGRIETKTETVGAVTSTYRYHYDLIGQLTDVYKDGALIAHYDYDSNGNRTGYSGVHGSVTSTEYDAQDRMLRYGDTNYFYTDNGELRSKVKGTELTKYDYDVLGNLRAVELPDGTKIEYIIDGQNRRIGKKVNGTLVQGFLYQDSLNPIAELDASGNVVARFVYGTRSNVPDYMVKGGVTYRIVADHLGSPRLVINAATGEIVQKMEYDEFGRVLTDTNPGFTPFGFAGGIYDQQTGLVRFGARDYDAEVGRWTAKDPIGFNGGDNNLYRYCRSNPINWIDPSGEAIGESLAIGWGTALVEPSPVGEVVMTVYTIGVGGYLVWEGGKYLYNKWFADAEESNENGDSCPNVKYPGKNPAKSPGDGFEWRGKGTPESGQGNWYNPKTGETYHPDLSHPAPVGPHWDYRAPNGTQWRVFPDGSVLPK